MSMIARLAASLFSSLLAARRPDASRASARIGVCLAALALCGDPARANDTSFGWDNRGVVYEKNAAVEMASEDLLLSMRRVRVVYEFVNTSDAPQTVDIAFPLPEIKLTEDADAAPPPARFDNFVDGRAVDTTILDTAHVQGEDVTPLLRDYKLPLNPYDAAPMISGLPSEAVKRLVAAKALDPSTVAEKGDAPTPAWSWRRIYHWRQDFAPRAKVSVKHEYAPSLTTHQYGYPIGVDDDAFARSVCAGAAFKARSRADNPPWSMSVLDYVLGTGGNWAGGKIKTFRLTVEKEGEGDLVSFCGSNVRKTGPTTFVMEAANFAPAARISVAFLVKPHR
jgi:hypothetical protein